MSNLYRVITTNTWLEAKKSGFIPRCGNDNKADGVHLNVLEAVDSTASTYFSPEEQPLVLEIDISDFSEQIDWLEPTGEFNWHRPLAKIDNLPIAAVVNVHNLEHYSMNGKSVFKMIKHT